MVVNSGHRYTIPASIIAVVVVSLFFAIHKYSDSPESLVGDLVADQSKQNGESLDESLPSALSDEHSVIGDYSRPGQDTYEYETHVSIDVSGAKVLVVAVEATLHEVLEGLTDKALVGVVDLRPGDESVAEDTQPEKQSFRFSGSVDDVLRFVMDQYNYSYVISQVSSTGTQVQTPVTKLFLYETMQGEDARFIDEQYLSPASAEAGSAADYPESGGSPGIDLERGAKKQVDLSEVLRNRALSAANLPASVAGSSTSQKHSLSGESSSAGSAPASDSFDDEAMRSRLADMTRRASEEVQALAAGLKEAEKSLEAQHNNAYGETVP